jgi:hypothetical protein
MYCPFVYAKVMCDESLVPKNKQLDIRIACYEDKCPIKIWEPKKKIGTVEIAGRCSIIINICEECSQLHKCKKTGDSKEECRQERIDSMFRISTPKPVEPVEPAQTEVQRRRHTPVPAEPAPIQTIGNEFP